jgi:DNA-directed RNA polymerase specialized sigma24 family protein
VRARWEGLHAALVGSVTTLPAANQFQDLRRSEPALAPFDCAATLIAHLTRREGDLDRKDQIYAVLVRAVQARAPCSRLAHALLWCGLWPGLDRVYRRRLRYFARDPDELTEAISVAFTALVGRIDLASVHRIAATLVRSTDRDVMYERQRVPIELAADATGLGEAPAWVAPAAREPDGIRPTGLSFAGELAALRARLAPVIGSDADLVLAVLVLDTDQREAAALLGLSHDAARKRLQRALRRLRTYLQIA